MLVNGLYLEDYLKIGAKVGTGGYEEEKALNFRMSAQELMHTSKIQGSIFYKEYGAHVDDSTRFQGVQ